MGKLIITGTVFRCQKRPLQVMCTMKPTDSCRGKFKENSFLTLTAIYIYECLKFLVNNQHKFMQCEKGHGV